MAMKIRIEILSGWPVPEILEPAFASLAIPRGVMPTNYF
jgi:hypothetical protein